MTVFIVVTIARQFEGDMISTRFEKAYTKRELAEEYAKTLSKTFTETIQVPGVGPIEFFCERGVHEVEVTE